MRCVVLGGCGFIGSHVVDRLLTEGHSVRVVARHPEPARGVLPLVDYRWGDCADPGVVSEALEGCDAVIHAFSATTPGSANLDPKADVQKNLLPLLTLLDLMVEKRVRRLVYLSSGGTVYGVPEVIPTPESHPLRPIGSYAIMKVAMESYIGMAARNRGVRPVILRPANAYGERQGLNGAEGAVSALMRCALRKERFDIWGDGSVVRDYLHVADLARVCAQAAENQVTGTFNIGSGVGTSLLDLVDLVAQVTGRRMDVGFGEARSVDVPVNVLDIQAARAALDWEPTISLREGLQRIWAWQQGQPD